MNPLLIAGLVVGGIWLLGRISRLSPSHPSNLIAATSQTTVSDATQADDTANLAGALVAGEGTFCCGQDHPIGAPLPAKPYSLAVPSVQTAPFPSRLGVGGGTTLPRTPVRSAPAMRPTRFGTVVLTPQRLATSQIQPTNTGTAPRPRILNELGIKFTQ